MNKIRLNHFKGKLEKERNRVYALLKQMEKNETINSNSEMSAELSFYDNHPSDMATEIFDKEIGMAFKENEISIIKKIDVALKSIEEGSYGKCKMCGKDINEERLEFIPYTQYCVNCQDELNTTRPIEAHNRAVEEQTIGTPFGFGFNDSNSKVEFDAEDSYQAVGRFNRLENELDAYTDEDEEYVEPIEKISNEQYKNQLP